MSPKQGDTMNAGVAGAGQPGDFGMRGGMEIADLLRIAAERRLIMLSAAGIGLLLGIIATFLITPMYRATALLELNSPATQLVGQADVSNQASQSVNTQELLATQLGLLRSDALARRVVQDLNLVADPAYGGVDGARQTRVDRAIRVLKANTLVEAQRGSLLMSVNYASPDPQTAARIANALAKGFIASSLERRYDSSSYARDFLSNQLAATKRSLEDSERQLNSYAMGSGIFRAPAQINNGISTEGSSLLVESLDSLSKALVDARVKRVEAEQAYRSGAGGTNAAQTESTTILRQQKAELEAELAQKARIFQPDYPEMRELESRIAAINRGISQESGTVGGGRRADLRAAYEAATRTEASLAAQVAALKQDVQGERGKSIQYNILQREVDTNRALYDALLQRYKEIGVAGGIGQSFISLVDDAEPPLVPFRPNLVLNAAIGVLGGFALGILLAVVTHLFFDNIVTPQDVRTKLGLPVLGVVPQERKGATLFETLQDRKSAISEAYYSARTALRFSSPEGAPHALLLTSSRPGEGKSTSAYALASIFARAGDHVLLMDADLRKPTFVAQGNHGGGLAKLLGSDEPLSAFVEDTKIENLKLLPVGRYTGSAAELLGSARLPALVAEAKANFTRVIIDGPPVLGLADAPILASTADKTLIVIESSEARTGAITEMIRRLHSSGADIAGIILTKVKEASHAYNYYSYQYGAKADGEVGENPIRSIDVGGADG